MRTSTPRSRGARSRVNPQVWFKIFHEPRGLLACLVELFKNCFDWSATQVKVITDEGRDKLRIVDDGSGMNAANREAFLSVGHSTAGSDMSGAFGTGSKKIVFTFSSFVRVVTAPEDEPDRVYICEFTPLQLAQDYSDEPTDFWHSELKTSHTWPHEHQFGTDIVYTLADPGSRSIHRGAALAQKLSHRLDYVLVNGGMVLVDGERLPSKQLEGRIYLIEWPAEANPAIGRIKLLFYRPSKRAADEDLRMTGRAIGEVSFRDVFLKLLPEDLRDRVPKLFLEGEVCGLISAAFLNEHATERRDSYDVHVADDERVVELLRILKQVELDVSEHLGIKLRQADSAEAEGKAEIAELIDLLQRRFNPDGDVPEGHSGTDDDDKDTKKRRRQPQPPQPRLPHLTINRNEFALGEHITIRLVVPDGSTDGFHFYTQMSLAKPQSQTSAEVELVASEIGRGIVQAINGRTGQTASVEYEVVAERYFYLSAKGPIGIPIGSEVTVQGINCDKLRGPLHWELEGHGALNVMPKGTSARFVPNRTGRARIRAYDTANPDIQGSCEVLVLPNQGGKQPPFRIRDQYFTLESNVPDTSAYKKPVTIINAGDGEVHRMVVNPWAPGYQAALKGGSLQQFLAYSAAIEFAKRFCVDWDEIEPSDLQSVMLEVQNEAVVLFQEMMTA